MARPSTWSDLPERDRRGDELARWSGYNLMEHPSVAKHLVAAAEAAQKAGMIVDRDGIYTRPTDEEIETRLLRAQEHWDKMQAKYRVAVDYSATSGDLWDINNWARENGLPLIKPAEKEEVSF